MMKVSHIKDTGGRCSLSYLDVIRVTNCARGEPEAFRELRDTAQSLRAIGVTLATYPKIRNSTYAPVIWWTSPARGDLQAFG